MYFQDEIISFHCPFFIYPKKTFSPLNWDFAVGQQHTSMSIEIYTDKIGNRFMMNMQDGSIIKHEHEQCDIKKSGDRVFRKYFFQRMAESNLIVFDLMLKKNNGVVRFRIQSANHDISGFEEVFHTFSIDSVKFDQARNFKDSTLFRPLGLDIGAYQNFIKKRFNEFSIGEIRQPHFFTFHSFPVIDAVSCFLQLKIGIMYGSCYMNTDEGFRLETACLDNFHLWNEPINQIFLWNLPGYNGRRIYTPVSNTNALLDVEKSYGYLNLDDVVSVWDCYVNYGLKQLKWLGLQSDEEYQSDILFLFDYSQQSLMRQFKNFVEASGYPTFV